MVTNCALALTKTVTAMTSAVGAGDAGDIRHWNPALGDSEMESGDGSTTATATTATTATTTATAIGSTPSRRPFESVKREDDEEEDDDNKTMGIDSTVTRSYTHIDELGWRKCVKYFTPS
jgi:hypothetical protein